MKKYAFFKYFIKKEFSRVGLGSGDPSPLGVGLGVQILPPIWFGDGGGCSCMEAGAGTGMLKPASDLPRCRVYLYEA